MSEVTDYNMFKNNVPHPLDRLDRIENLVADGMPDTNYCAEGRECWIEFKSPREPKRNSTPLFGSNHKLSQSQKNWFLRQSNAEGKGFILICTDKRWMLINGMNADHVNTATVAELMKMSVWWSMKPIPKERWAGLRCTLMAASL